jgi:hypothetical protein
MHHVTYHLVNTVKFDCCLKDDKFYLMNCFHIKELAIVLTTVSFADISDALSNCSHVEKNTGST